MKLPISPFIKVKELGAAGIVQLNRPEAFNTLRTEMFRQLFEIIKPFEHEKDVVIFKGLPKLFCCGGDMKQISQGSIEDVQEGYVYCAKTFDMIVKFQVPFVTLIDGLNMGGASTFTMSARYRVATERAVFAMPETAIGYFPDFIACFFLSRLSHHVGFYLALTGARLRGYDMKKIGLATHYIESAKLDKLENELINCKSHEDVAKVLDRSDSSLIETELDLILPKINKCFGGATVEEIIENLETDGSDWAMNTIKLLRKMSPTSLKVAFRSITLGKNLSLNESLKLESRLATRHKIESDMKEGMRAMMFEKDFKPQWNPRTIEEVTEEQVERFFEPLYHGINVIGSESKAQHKL